MNYVFNSKGKIDSKLENIHFNLNIGGTDCPTYGCGCHKAIEAVTELLEYLLEQEGK